MLNKEEIIKIGSLARIKLSEEDIAKYQKDLSSVLDYVDALKEVDTDGLEIVSSVTGLENIDRRDEPVAVEYQEKIMANAPDRKDNYYKVKSIL